jgi:hypothetical protein
VAVYGYPTGLSEAPPPKKIKRDYASRW